MPPPAASAAIRTVHGWPCQETTVKVGKKLKAVLHAASLVSISENPSVFSERHQMTLFSLGYIIGDHSVQLRSLSGLARATGCLINSSKRVEGGTELPKEPFLRHQLY